tara:strand:+ start:62609 stop:62995 length:387 start_codon:yes stop_codon:yes gene_type:complete
MDVSIFLAKFWGWYLIIFFLILSIKPERNNQVIKDLKDDKFLILLSFMAIIIGLLNLLFHNFWKPNWTIIVTLIGWVSLFIGLFLFVLPNLTVKFLEIVNIKFVQVIYIFLFFIGVFLLNKGYGIILF